MNIEGAVVIVTGSATGLGAAVAQRLASKGGRVVINYTKSEDEARETAAACEKLGGEALLCRADVSDDADCRRMAEEAVKKWGRVDGLVNNAALSKITPHRDLEGLSGDDFLRIFSVNVVGPFQMVRAVAPRMQGQGRGAIVNVSSLSGMSGSGSSIAYAASQGCAEHHDPIPGSSAGSGDTGQRSLPRSDADPVVAGRIGRGALYLVH